MVTAGLRASILAPARSDPALTTLWTDPAGEDQPAVDPRLPPRDAGRELLRATQRVPELPRLCNAPEVEAGDATLQALPTNANQEIPTDGDLPGGSGVCARCSHHQVPESTEHIRQSHSEHQTRASEDNRRCAARFVNTNYGPLAQWQGGEDGADGMTDGSRGKGLPAGMTAARTARTQPSPLREWERAPA